MSYRGPRSSQRNPNARNAYGGATVEAFPVGASAVVVVVCLAGWALLSLVASYLNARILQ